jgi:sucrose phosphorylase
MPDPAGPGRLDHLIFLYGERSGRETAGRLEALIESYRPPISPPANAGGGPARPWALTERDSILITYGDQVQTPGEPPLRTLADFCERHLAGTPSTGSGCCLSGIHILPFYPWTSDDGFAVKDYRAVDPALGDWQDIARIGRRLRMMFDGVINHISSQSEWFQAFLRDEPAHRDDFIVVEGSPDLSQVVRPRAQPLLTRFKTAAGEKAVWTTFGEDQIDLNYRSPDVLLRILDLMLFYAARGAQLIRLDAIAYLWKEIGTPSIHLPQTHRIIQLIRAVLDAAAPHVMLVSETNVPHADNIAYFGNGYDEAQLVYNFALPPLVLHTLQSGSARVLSQWAADLRPPSDRTAFFNFLASHDGIGLNPARSLLDPAGIQALVRRALDHGGLISYKHNPDGSQSPYEMNINYFDALSDPKGGEPIETQVKRFMAAQAIMLAMPGVPGIYFHSLFGSRGWPEGVRQSGRSRTINRQKLDRDALEGELARPGSLRYEVLGRYARLLKARAATPAFHPHGPHRVLDCGEAAFALLRRSPDGAAGLICLQNVSGLPQTIALPPAEASGRWRDLVTGTAFDLSSQPALSLQPYQTLWLLAGSS